ncbi:MAG: bifunctional oligoribonuclease/PAP phosphatase NrnA [Ruminococcaceae bacterium]|nr:bifunctional oligoribonuclease/PAP phosphatase NrnA [Oscillospiraceae bacterium]
MQKKIKDGCRDLSLRRTARYLKKHDNYIIITHASPDGDTLGAGYALYYGLKEIGKQASVICPDVIPKKYDYFVHETDHVDINNATVISVDVADKRLLGSLCEIFGDKIDLAIDHHISNTRFSKNLYLDADAAATCQIIFELLTLMRVNINTLTAKALYTGIATDTGCFKYSNVTYKTHIITAQLYEYPIDAAEINKLMFDMKSRRLLELEQTVLNTAEFHFDDRCMLLTVTADIQEKTGCSGPDLEGLSVISRSVEGVDAGVTIKQTDDNEYKISLRTYPPLDASLICKKLGGGGHKGAAGASLEGDLESVKAQVLSAVREVMEETYAGTVTAK